MIIAQQSETLLSQHGNTDGLFLVRSKDGNVCHVVSVVYKGAPLHLLVERMALDEPFKVNGENFGQVTARVEKCFLYLSNVLVEE